MKHIKQLNFSVMAWLCFLKVLLESLVALHNGPLVLFSVYDIALNMMKNTQEPQEITFYWEKQFTAEWLLMGNWLASDAF